MLCTKNVRGRNTFYPEVLHVELQEYHIQDLGQRSSSAMGLISKTLRSISVSSVLLFLCFINDNICTRWSDIQLHNIKEPYSLFHFLLVGNLIACTLSLYRGMKLCVYKTLEICSKYELWGGGGGGGGGGNKICSKI